MPCAPGIAAEGAIGSPSCVGGAGRPAPAGAVPGPPYAWFVGIPSMLLAPGPGVPNWPVEPPAAPGAIGNPFGVIPVAGPPAAECGSELNPTEGICRPSLA